MLYYLAAPLALTGVVLALFDSPLVVSPVLLTSLGCFTYLIFVFVLNCSVNREQNKNPLRASAFLVLGLYVGLFAGRLLFSLITASFAPEAVHGVHGVISIVLVALLVIFLFAGLNASSLIIRREVSHQRFGHITEYDTDEFAQRIAAAYKLTERECQVLRLLLKGETAAGISKALVIAQGTAKAHISNIYKKLDVHTKEELFDLIPATRK